VNSNEFACSQFVFETLSEAINKVPLITSRVSHLTSVGFTDQILQGSLNKEQFA